MSCGHVCGSCKKELAAYWRIRSGAYYVESCDNPDCREELSLLLIARVKKERRENTPNQRKGLVLCGKWSLGILIVMHILRPGIPWLITACILIAAWLTYFIRLHNVSLHEKLVDTSVTSMSWQ